jgi:hypothetical protein
MHVDDFFAPTGHDEWFRPVDEPRMDVFANLRRTPSGRR